LGELPPEFHKVVGFEGVGRSLTGDHAREGLEPEITVESIAHDRHPTLWLSEAMATFGLLLTILVGRVHRVTAVPAFTQWLVPANQQLKPGLEPIPVALRPH